MSRTSTSRSTSRKPSAPSGRPSASSEIGTPPSRRIEPASDRKDDLAELAAGREAIVGSGGLAQWEGRGDRHTQDAGVEEGEHLVLHATGRERLLLERASTQGGAVDAGALAHQGELNLLALGARGDTDHGDPPAGGERSKVLGQVGGADELEDHIERTVLGEPLGRDHLGPERRHLLAQLLAAHRCRHARARRTGELDRRGADAAGATVYEQPLTWAKLRLRKERIVGGGEDLR